MPALKSDGEYSSLGRGFPVQHFPKPPENAMLLCGEAPEIHVPLSPLGKICIFPLGKPSGMSGLWMTLIMQCTS